MDAAQFFGGKYQKPEQVVPGPVQTFRAHEAGTDRLVFVHRVPIAEEQPQQAALLRLLVAALFRSQEAKKLVLDFGEDQGFWYVVTESEPQCLLLREWLQFEVDRSTSSIAKQKGPADVQPGPAAAASPPVMKQDGPGEFTRIFQSGLEAGAAAPAAPLHVVPSATAGSAVRPNEFSKGSPDPRLDAADSKRPEASAPPIRPSTAETPARVGGSQVGPGEFTRFFAPGLPEAAKPPSNRSAYRNPDRPSNPEVQRSADRPSRSGFVQRPNTPIPAALQKPSEAGEFTRLFSKPPQSASPYSAPGANANARNENLAGPFANLQEAPAPVSTPSQVPGEFTRIFGRDKVAEGPQTHAPAKAPAMDERDDPLRTPRPPASQPNPSGPSEYTMVIQGRRDPVPAPDNSMHAEPESLAANGSLAGATKPPAPAKTPSLGDVKPPQMPAGLKVPPAPAGLPSPASAQRSNAKLQVFFLVLALLTIVMILLAVFLLKK